MTLVTIDAVGCFVCSKLSRRMASQEANEAEANDITALTGD